MATAPILRSDIVATIRARLREFPVVALIGARQVGKTTLARQVQESWKGATHLYDLEDPIQRRELAEPMAALRELRGLVVLDEIQRSVDLFPVLRVLADRRPVRARFLLLGSASPELLQQSSESLAGRISFLQIDGFGLDEIGAESWKQLWIRGGMPRSFLAPTEAQSLRWRHEFVRTYLERDLPRLGVAIGSDVLDRFWRMLGHYHGQIWNGAEFARSFGVSLPTVGRYLDVLCATFVARRLRPWHENLGKRQVKASRVYVSDSGLLHALLEVADERALRRHPRSGASFEGFAIGEIARHLGARPEECYFWRAHTGAELDLLVVRGTQRRGFEIKLTAEPDVTASMRSAMNDLGLETIDVIHVGDSTFPLASDIRAVAVHRVLEDIKALR